MDRGTRPRISHNFFIQKSILMNVDVEFIGFIFIFFCYIFLKDYIESVVYSTGARQKGTDQQGHNQKPEINTKFGQCGVIDCERTVMFNSRFCHGHAEYHHNPSEYLATLNEGHEAQPLGEDSVTGTEWWNQVRE